MEMSELSNLFHSSMNQEDLVFKTVEFMKPYIEDLDSIEYAFLNINAETQVDDNICGLRQRSSEAISKLFKRFSRKIDEGMWSKEVMSILFPFLQDQFETRLRLLGVYWVRMKAQQFVTANADFHEMGMMISPLTAFIQECGDMGLGESTTPEGHTSASTEVEPAVA